jgi:hypothetical protein
VKKHLTVLTLVWAAAALQAAEITGKWNAVFDTQIGKQSYFFEFKAAGDKVTGKAVGDVNGENRHTAEIQDGKLAGDALTFAETFAFRGNDLTITYSGKVTGDEIRFTRKVGEFATVVSMTACGPPLNA